MEDEFDDFARGLTTPATAAEAIVPSDTDALGYASRALYVGQGGDITVQMLSGDIVTLQNVQPGALYALRITQVRATGTTASGLLGMR